MASLKKVFKRLFDILLSLLVLTLGFPLYAWLALLIKCSSKGPIFYSCSRVGLYGKTFQCLKFRTMYQGSDQILQKLLAQNHEMKKEWDLYYKLKNDPRITPIGKFFRKTSLDELPQFWNVLKGDLSIVGPRPCVKEELSQNFGDRTQKILSMRPGITGLWQISGRNNLSWKERAFLEEFYIDEHSFFLDLWILFKTIPVMVFSRGAY